MRLIMCSNTFVLALLICVVYGQEEAANFYLGEDSSCDNLQSSGKVGTAVLEVNHWPSQALGELLFSFSVVPRLCATPRAKRSRGPCTQRFASTANMRVQRKGLSRGRSSRAVLASLVESKQTAQATSIALCLGASALWGTYPSTIKSFFASPGSTFSAGEVTFIRFLVMALVSFAYAASSDDGIAAIEDASEIPWSEQFRRRVPSSVYLAAGEIGALSFAGSFFNVIGIQQIPALIGAVLLTFLNVLTPLIAVVAGATEKERTVDLTTWFTSLVALVATIYALLPDLPPNSTGQVGESGGLLPSLGAGELSTVTAAFFFGAQKVRLSSILKVHPADQITAGRLVAQCGLAAAGLAVVDETNLLHELLPSQQGGMGMNVLDVLNQAERWLSGISLQQVGWILSSSMLSGFCATWCQGRAQSTVSAPTAQLFYATVPLFAALWALLLLQEPITNHEVVGGAILLFGLGIASQTLEPIVTTNKSDV